MAVRRLPSASLVVTYHPLRSSSLNSDVRTICAISPLVTWGQSDISAIGAVIHSIICDIGDKVTSQLLTLCFSYL